ncbi:hypothetical protein L915_19090, partial [Phytophthora nicotianae]
KAYDILASWKGLEPIEDTWESAKSLAKDIPVFLKRLASLRGNTRLERHVGK